MSRKILSFSEPFINVELIKGVADYPIKQRTIVINTSNDPLKIEESYLPSWRSSVYFNTNIHNVKSIVCINTNVEDDTKTKFPFADDIIKRWKHIYDIIPLPHLKETKLWRSDKENINGVNFNLWFAISQTDCGIHNKHDFKELHTQIYGIGLMQKFYRDIKETLYQQIYMSPGYTHEPFCDENNSYPWHQYYSKTDCIWLVMEFPIH